MTAKAGILTRKWTIYLTDNLNDRSIIYELSWGRGRKSGKSQVYPELFLSLCGVFGPSRPQSMREMASSVRLTAWRCHDGEAENISL